MNNRLWFADTADLFFYLDFIFFNPIILLLFEFYHKLFPDTHPSRNTLTFNIEIPECEQTKYFLFKCVSPIYQALCFINVWMIMSHIELQTKDYLFTTFFLEILITYSLHTGFYGPGTLPCGTMKGFVGLCCTVAA